MGYASKRIDKEYLMNRISSRRILEFNYAGDYEVYGRACMYLDMQEKSIEAFKKAAYMKDAVIEKCRNSGNLNGLVKEVHMKANFLRLAGEVEEARKVYRQAKEMYEELLESNRYPHYRNNYISEMIVTLFMLKEYKECVKLGEDRKQHYGVWLSQAILDNDNESIGRLIEYVKKHGKEVKCSPGQDSGTTIGIWDWYEIAMQLIGEPSRIDYIKW